MIRIFACLAMFALLLGCSADQSMQPPKDLGAFRLGHNVVVASKMKKGPISRDATEQEWVDVLTRAVDSRFGRYQGNQLYHMGISVEGYMLAPPGVPLIYNPRSALIINVTVWDDAAAAKLNEKPRQFTIYEDTTGESFAVGSGNVRTKEEQLQGLAENAMDAVEDWMAEQHAEKGWFAPRPGAATTATVPRLSDSSAAAGATASSDGTAPAAAETTGAPTQAPDAATASAVTGG
ncbi:hypothetical protein [Marinibacterium profundimaris]|uniref:hypothetical protein n=1 Tax=Marinibacterium profundimaris TaxID=1679460 RepID=UPI001E3FE179|nr:hypothetical protein [Marinibacterium profundimaris]